MTTGVLQPAPTVSSEVSEQSYVRSGVQSRRTEGRRAGTPSVTCLDKDKRVSVQWFTRSLGPTTQGLDTVESDTVRS